MKSAFVSVVCLWQFSLGATPSLQSEPIMSDGAMFSFTHGDQLRALLQRMMLFIDQRLMDPIMTFPFDTRLVSDEETVAAAQSLYADIEESSDLARQLEKRTKRSIASAISCSDLFNGWRRAVGFLAANMVNLEPHDASLREAGTTMIVKFARFVKIWSLVSAGFISNKQFKLLSSVGVDARSNKDTQIGAVLQEMLKEEHRRKSCAFCSSVHKLQLLSTVEESMQIMSQSLSCSHLTKKINCNKFFVHVSQLADMLLAVMEKEENAHLVSSVEEFCSNSGQDVLRFLSLCKGARGVRSTQIASKLGRACKEHLSFEARAVILPSLMSASLTPLAFEKTVQNDDNDDEDDTDSVAEGEILVPAPSAEEFVQNSMAKLTEMNRFSFEQPLVVSFQNSLATGSGPRKEWVAKLIESLTIPSFGLFEYSDEREVFVKPTVSGQSRLEEFRQLGRVMGVALKDRMSPGIGLTPGAVSFFTITDDLSPFAVREFLKIEDPVKASSLAELAKTYLSTVESAPPIESLGLTFEGGLAVDADNLTVYIAWLTDKIVLDSIKPQMRQIVMGVYEVIPYGHLSFLSTEELSHIFRGESLIDVALLRAATSYTPAESISESNILIRWFWQIVGEFSEELKQNLLRFVSGSPFVPVHGFAGLHANRKWLLISVEDGLAMDSLPKAQVCFTQLRMPRYSSRDIMRERLVYAIRNAISLEEA